MDNTAGRLMAGWMLVPSQVSALSVIVLVALLLAWPGVSRAQDDSSSTNLEDMSEEQIFLYLANEKVLAPGIGFINAQLGDSFADVIRIWGEPVDSRKTGILGATEILYQPDPNLWVVFTGKDTIDSISVKGNSAALFRTRNGVRLGMHMVPIAQLHAHEESRTENNRIEFNKLGISYTFVDDRLDKVVVYPPDS